MADTVANPFQRVQRVHFVGIAGAGMSGIAEVIANLGYDVSGSDLNDSPTCERLRANGIRFSLGHSEQNVLDADVVVVSSAIRADNPELAAARKARIPVIPRAEMLAEIMRFRFGIAVAGTHGKTTTTSLVASVLAEGGLDPTYVIGGLLTATGSNAALGEGKYFVAEADESDASFLHLTPIFAIVTNIDADHLDTYRGELPALQDAFVDFVQRLPFYGMAALCLDDAGVREILPRLNKPFRTYGTSAKADVVVRNITQHGLMTRFEVSNPDHDAWCEFSIGLPGKHNVLNAVAAITIARELSIDDEVTAKALSDFQGIARRLQVSEDITVSGKRITIVDDYAHHPTELAATLGAIQAAWPQRRVVAVFQPHRYTRTRDVFEDYVSVLSETDRLILLEVYAAGEAPISGADGRSLTRAIRLRGQTEPVFAENLDEALALVPDLVEDTDVLLVMGAGSIASFVPSLRASDSQHQLSLGKAAPTGTSGG